jgi:hypothetical protein
VLARVVGRGLARDPALVLEAAQDAREIARVQLQVTHQLARGERRPVRQLVQHPHFRQRELGIEVALEHAYALCVEAVEGAHGLHVRLADRGGHGAVLRN